MNAEKMEQELHIDHGRSHNIYRCEFENQPNFVLHPRYSSDRTGHWVRTLVSARVWDAAHRELKEPYKLAGLRSPIHEFRYLICCLCILLPVSGRNWRTQEISPETSCIGSLEDNP